MAGEMTTAPWSAAMPPPPVPARGTSPAAAAPAASEGVLGGLALQAAEVAGSGGLPRKRINSPQDLDIFMQSKLCHQLMSFTAELAESIKGKPMQPQTLPEASPLVRGLVGMLDQLEQWIKEFPPLDQPMRFGNKAFRQWHARLCERAEDLFREVLSQAGAPESRTNDLALELACYLRGSFGDERRIDYGTGHEAAFLAILFILGANGVAAKTDAPDLLLLVFAKYMRVMRCLQTVYVLEPAGSHGVWGLDDFHALPFLFGASQLIGMDHEVPTGEVYKERTITDFADQYFYVDAVRQVLLAKRGAPFHETSPMLYDITAVPTWQKTYVGLTKMYKAEVLGKFPVIQHFLFGDTLRWPGDPAPAASS